MSRRSSRVKERFDYKEFSKSGKKVSITKEFDNLAESFSLLSVMDPAQMVSEKNVLALKAQRLLEEFRFDNLFDIDDIREGQHEIRNLIDSFDIMRENFKGKLGENFEKHFPNFDHALKPLTKWVSEARVEIKRRKEEIKTDKEIEQSEEEKNKYEREQEESRLRKEQEERDRLEVDKLDMEERKKNEEKAMAKEKSRLRNAQKYLKSRIDFHIAIINSETSETSTSPEDIEKNILVLKGFIKEHFDIFMEIENLFEEEYEDEFGDIFTSSSERLQDSLSNLTRLSQKAKEEEKKFQSKNVAIEMSEKIQYFNGVSLNLNERFLLLKQKCVCVWSEKSDSEILNLQKALSSIDEDYSKFLNWITELIKVQPSDNEDAKDCVVKANGCKQDLKELISKYKNDLKAEIEKRDLSDEKIKLSGTSLGVKMKKFSGYESSVDFYTFKSEFEEFVVPNMRRNLLVKHLKNDLLEGQALQVVKELEDLKVIWERLQRSFGDVSLIMNKKLKSIEESVPLWQIKSDHKLVQMITDIRNSMMDLRSLALKHNIEGTLFHESNLAKIYDILGKKRQSDLIKKFCDNNFSVQQIWDKIIDALEKDIKVKEQMVLFEKKSEKVTKKKSEHSFSAGTYSISQSDKKCFVCEKTGHVPTVTKKGNHIINYFSCEKFAKMTPKERFRFLISKRFCIQCISPGFKVNHDKPCFDKYKCPHDSHKEFKSSLHVLVCDDHKNNPENINLLKLYKEKEIGKNSSHEEFSKEIGNFHTNSSYKANSEECEAEMAIYMLQTICINKQKFNLFYDSGCGDMVCRRETVDRLSVLDRAKNLVKGPLVISGVGDHKSVSDYGRYHLSLPLYDGSDINLSGICLEKITSTFPTYPLNEVEKDIQLAFSNSNDGNSSLPKLPKTVGGDTDVMIGIQYLKYFPEKVFSLPNGLSIYESYFLNPDGSRGIVGGPHKVFTKIHRSLGSNANTCAYLHEIARLYSFGYKVTLDTPLLGAKETSYENTRMFDDINDANFAKKSPENLKRFEACESAGTEASYRCVDCRGCEKCVKSEKIESISIQEEIEQEMIDKSVKVDLEKSCTTALLPFLSDPAKKLAPNEEIALKVYKRVTKNLKPEEKEAVRKAMKKLHDMGYTEYLDDLPQNEREIIFASCILHFLPWILVWNRNSLSTPCRPAFHGSLPTLSGYSLNDLLAKGTNNMNQLLIVFLKWRIRVCAYHTDLQTMYNRVTLDPSHWCYQLFYYSDELDPNKEPRVKVMKSLIYGIKSSGNQAERGVRETARLQKLEYPRQFEVLNDETYVDDVMSGENSLDECKKVTDGLSIVLNRGGFNLKGITFSGVDPPSDLSEDQVSIKVGGLKWFSKSDLLSLNTCENFIGKRGKRSRQSNPEKLTRRMCASRAGEIFDLGGRFTPITAGIKLDLSELSNLKLDWDDKVPANLVDVWKKNFQLINDLNEVKYKRVVVPVDALNLNFETLEMCDASQNLACSAIYARFKRKNGMFSSQLIFSRSKIIPKNMTMPRAELMAAKLNATTGHVLSKALGEYMTDRVAVTDSQIVLYWICNPQLQLKKWVRNRVIEVNRLSDKSMWYYVEGKSNTADLGTRKGVTIPDILDGSRWVTGESWAKLDKSKFPILNSSQIRLSNEDLKSHGNELVKNDVVDNEWIKNQLESFQCYASLNDKVVTKVSERYILSNYLIDPNRFRFRKVVKILSIVVLFVQCLFRKIKRQSMKVSLDILPDHFQFSNDRYLVTSGSQSSPYICKPGLVIKVEESQLLMALEYFFLKASNEVKKFVEKRVYEKISFDKNGILFYSGRILPSQQINDKLNLCDVCDDLKTTTFCVPLIEKFSPLSFAIVNEVHWFHNDVIHSGIETTMRFISSIAHIFELRSLVKQFKEDCPRCRYLEKKSVKVVMGPVSDDHLTIAPPFYNSYVDIFGPFSSYSNVNKRASVKIWFSIFCCCATGAIDLKVMEDYSTPSFILSFIRFSCKVGFPKKVMPDMGSQLVKACKTTTIKFSDVRNKLFEFGVLYDVCPVGSHYMHGKVERKIRHVRESFEKSLNKDRLSIIQWESLGDQIANSINNLPIAIGNLSEGLENLDLITPNRLLLAKNNDRCPVGTLSVSDDVTKIIKRNNELHNAWFKAWLVSYVPTLMLQPKWFQSNRDLKIGDVILFLKSEKEFQNIYQYGLVCDMKISRDRKIRQITVEYQNHNENVKRYTTRGTREVVVIHSVNELGLMRELNELFNSL